MRTWLQISVPLQLGCVGSRGTIHYGASADVTALGKTKPVYFDILNIDRYDIILGVPWLTSNNATMDFTKHEVRIGEIPLPTLSVGEEAVLVSERKQKH